MVEFSLIHRIARHARDAPDRPAYIEPGGRTLTYRQLSSDIQRLISWLNAFYAGDGNAGENPVVMLRCGNRIEFPVWFLAALATGADVLTFPCDTADTEAAALARRAGVSLFIDERSSVASMLGEAVTHHLSAQLPKDLNTLELTADASPCSSGAGAVLLATSGSTDTPRIARRTTASLDAMAVNGAEAMGLTVGERVLAAPPLAHSYGLEHGLLIPLWAGATVLLCPGLNPEAITAQLARGASLLPAVPAMIEWMPRLPQARGAATALRLAYSAGGPLPARAYDAFGKAFGLRVGQVYGMSEIGSVTFNDPAAADFDPAAIGRPLRDVSMRLLNQDISGEGELAVRAPSMFEGYLHQPAPLIDGYLPTGDLARANPNGSFCITGRTRLLIDVAGRKVNPIEVESVLLAHPAVAQCVVTPVRQSVTAQRLAAIVVPTDPDHPPTPDALRAFVRQRLTDHKTPRLITFRRTLPRTPSGKIDRAKLEVS